MGLESSVDSESLCLCKEVQLKVLKMPLGAKDKEKVNFTFGIYDFDGSGKMDAFWIADALRALGLNPTNAQAEALGSLKQKKQKPSHRLNSKIFMTNNYTIRTRVVTTTTWKS